MSSSEFANRKLVGTPHEQLASISLLKREGFEIFVDSEDFSVGSPLVHGVPYEPHVTRVIRDRLKAGMAFLDIGANIGYFTMLAASLVGPSGLVFAVEPNPRNAKFLYASCQKNAFKHVRIYQAAAVDQWTTLFFNAVHSNGMVTTMQGSIEEIVGRVSVLGLPIDDILHGVRTLDFIKIDVEGAEHRALLGAQDTLRKFRPVIVSELTPEALPGMSGVDAETYLEMLTGLKYDISAIGDVSLHPCGRDSKAVLAFWRSSGRDHIDILAEPA